MKRLSRASELEKIDENSSERSNTLDKTHLFTYNTIIEYLA